MSELPNFEIDDRDLVKDIEDQALYGEDSALADARGTSYIPSMEGYTGHVSDESPETELWFAKRLKEINDLNKSK